MDSKTTVEELKQLVKSFCEARDWDQFHNPKDLIIGIVTEAAELLQHARFKSESELKAVFSDEIKREKISEEIADTLYFLLRLSQMYDVDLTIALTKKISKNEIKYPVEKVKGLNKKYSEY